MTCPRGCDRERGRGRIEHDAIDLRAARERHAGFVREVERRRIIWLLGTVLRIQFVAVFQPPVAGFASHLALPART